MLEYVKYEIKYLFRMEVVTLVVLDAMILYLMPNGMFKVQQH